MTLAQRLARYRERKGWSKRQLGRIAKVPQSRISEIEAGKNKQPTAGTIRRLARALDISMEELWEGEHYGSTEPPGTDVIGVVAVPVSPAVTT